jgi:hypothetical protein
MRVLCIGRHAYLSEHLCEYFRDVGAETIPAVGLSQAIELAPAFSPEVVVCDYDLLATMDLDAWERDPLLSTVPVIAVSLTRRPAEVHLLDSNGISAFLYLPTLTLENARTVLHAALWKQTAQPPRSALTDARATIGG